MRLEGLPDALLRVVVYIKTRPGGMDFVEGKIQVTAKLCFSLSR